MTETSVINCDNNCSVNNIFTPFNDKNQIEDIATLCTKDAGAETR